MLLALLTTVLPANVQDPAATAVAPVTGEPQWTTSLSTYWIEPPHDSGYLSGILSADRGDLHLEAHWAYEDRDTLSIFAGKSFPIEGDLKGSVTPRIGLAGGDSDGIIPAVALELGWENLNFTTDVEYMIGTSDETEDFLYDWSELTYAISDRFTVGLVGERTNVFDQELSVDRGFLAGVSFGKTWLTAYVFNPDQDDPYVTLSFGAGF
jgi:hypothetical protein